MSARAVEFFREREALANLLSACASRGIGAGEGLCGELASLRGEALRRLAAGMISWGC